MDENELLALAEEVTKADAAGVAADEAYTRACHAYDDRYWKVFLDYKAEGDQFAKAWAWINAFAERETMLKARYERSAALIRFYDLERRFKIALARAGRKE